MITYSPKVGEVLECDFGFFSPSKSFDGKIPPEIVKRRLAVILNGKLNNGGCIVIPISSSRDQNAIDRGMHIELDKNSFEITNFYDIRERWAKTELIQMISKERLFKIQGTYGNSGKYLHKEVVTQIQKAVIRAINAKVLLT